MTLTKSSSAPGPGGSATWSMSMNVFETSPGGIRSVSGAACSAAAAAATSNAPRSVRSSVSERGLLGRIAPAALERVDELRLIVRRIRTGEDRLVGHDGELIAHRVAEPLADLVDHAGHPLHGVQVRRRCQHDRRRVLGRRGRRRLRGCGRFGGKSMLLRRLGSRARGGGFGGRSVGTHQRPADGAGDHHRHTDHRRDDDGAAAQLRPLRRERLHRIGRLQVVDQRLQLTQRGGVGGPAHPLPVLFHRQLSLGQRAVEYLAGLVAVAVLRTGARCLAGRHETKIVRGRDPSPQTDADAPAT